MLILLVLLNLPAEEQGTHLEISSVFTVIHFVWQAPKASATQKDSAAICQLADECYHEHLIAGYVPARPIHCFPCLQ